MIINWWKAVIVLGFIAGINCKVRYFNGQNELVETNVKKRCGTGLLNGEKTNTELFPWMVNIYVIVNTPDRRIRSTTYFYGTIIHPKTVITLASFTPSEPANLVVSTSTDVEKKYQERMVEKIYKHKNYKRKVFMATAHDINAYDVAILILLTPFYFNGFINSICLPTKYSEIDRNNCYSLYATIAGLENIEMKRSKHRLIDTEKCQDLDEFNKLSVFYDSFTCSETESYQKSFCSFGNAVPLICKNKNSFNYYLSGILIKRCNNKSNVTLNANIVHVSHWIKDVLTEEHLSH